MYFSLRDGVPHWATHKIITQKQEIYAYSEEEKENIISNLDVEYTVEDVPLPSQEILNRAKEIEGKTFSKSEFEKMLFEEIPEDKEKMLWQIITDLQLDSTITNQVLTETQLEIEALKGGH